MVVATLTGGAVGIGLAQVRRDLRRTPLLLELVLHDLAQLRLAGQQRPSWPAQPFAGAGMGQVAAVDHWGGDLHMTRSGKG